MPHSSQILDNQNGPAVNHTHTNGNGPYLGVGVAVVSCIALIYFSWTLASCLRRRRQRREKEEAAKSGEEKQGDLDQ